ncbi:MAG: hypothetical protein EBY21_13985 [Alphaproteobacteria bacterium]|nr:hypothetical protein [Alphaproteobacteria bacterium]
MTAYVIRAPQSANRQETWIVGALILIIACGAAVYGFVRDEAAQQAPLLDWQVNSFSGLGPDDQAIHSALIVAGEEIGYMNSDFGDWPSADELDKILLAPFYKDEFWKLHGSVQWSLVRAASYENGGDTGYLGIGGDRPGQSAYLLIFRHRHVGAAYANQIDIWIHRDVQGKVPDTTKAESLVAAGWRQVIVYSGADEFMRLKGK